MSGTVLELENVTKSFSVGGRKVEAVRGVSLYVGEGEAVALVGESGCGKSTLARLTSRLEEPESGKITLCSRDISHLSGKALREARAGIRMIFQSPLSSFDPRYTLGASICEALGACGVPHGERKKKAEKLLEAVGLGKERMHAHPSEVSGGECQRAAIARAIAAHPRILVCDEATSALDVSVQAQIMELLAGLAREYNMSFLFISHDLALVSGFCARTYVMKFGGIVESGDTACIIKNPREEYTKKLIASVFPV